MDECPKCGGTTGAHPLYKGIDNWCSHCQGWVHHTKCEGCGATYYILNDDNTRGSWHNHQCDPARERKIEDSRKAHEGHVQREPTLHQRLRDGFNALADFSDDYK